MGHLSAANEASAAAHAKRIAVGLRSVGYDVAEASPMDLGATVGVLLRFSPPSLVGAEERLVGFRLPNPDFSRK